MTDTNIAKVTNLSLVVPVFNEAETVGLFLDRVAQVFAGDSEIQVEIIFVIDGSSDGTLDCFFACQQRDGRVRIVDHSRNFGKVAAMTAGLKTAKGDAAVPIDVDLQYPPELILEMIAKWREGYEVVLGSRVAILIHWLSRPLRIGFTTYTTKFLIRSHLKMSATSV